jgi:hypothetical protein
VALISILILDLPFWPERRRARRRGDIARGGTPPIAS